MQIHFFQEGDALPINFEHSINWYGVFFVAGLFAVWLLMRLAASIRGDISSDTIDGVMLWISIGAVFGGHLGDLVLYRPADLLLDPWQTILLGSGGMSFHGGVVGVALAVWLYATLKGVDVWALADIASGSAPAGIFFGRVGNFLSHELYGIATDLPWGMQFSGGGPVPRHPTQLYEALLEGVMLFGLLYSRATKLPNHLEAGRIFGLFLVFYGASRIAIEPLRADAYWIAFWGEQISRGQLYCIPMLVGGVIIAGKRQRPTSKK